MIATKGFLILNARKGHREDVLVIPHSNLIAICSSPKGVKFWYLDPITENLQCAERSFVFLDALEVQQHEALEAGDRWLCSLVRVKDNALINLDFVSTIVTPKELTSSGLSVPVSGRVLNPENRPGTAHAVVHLDGIDIPAIVSRRHWAYFSKLEMVVDILQGVRHV